MLAVCLLLPEITRKGAPAQERSERKDGANYNGSQCLFLYDVFLRQAKEAAADTFIFYITSL